MAQIFYSLSERHAHRELMPSDIKHGGLPEIIAEALLLVVDHAAHLPRLHRQQASPGDTALLLVCLSLTQCFGGSQSPPGKRLASDKICALQAPSMAMLFFQTTRDLTELVGFDNHVWHVGGDRFGQLLIDFVCGFASGQLPGSLGDTPEAMDTGLQNASSCSDAYSWQLVMLCCSKCPCCLGGSTMIEPPCHTCQHACGLPPSK